MHSFSLATALLISKSSWMGTYLEPNFEELLLQGPTLTNREWDRLERLCSSTTLSNCLKKYQEQVKSREELCVLEEGTRKVPKSPMNPSDRKRL